MIDERPPNFQRETWQTSVSKPPLETHGRELHCLLDRLRIAEVVLVYP